MQGKAIVKNGRIKYIEFDKSLLFNYKDGDYVIDLQIYNQISTTKISSCSKTGCDNIFEIKINSKQNIKYCPDHRRKKKNV